MIKLIIRKILNSIKYFLSYSKDYKIIPPEIKGDKLSSLLTEYSSLDEVKNILEIGSSSGDGSTKVIFESIIKSNRQLHVDVYCLEVIKDRFDKLSERYKEYQFIHPLNYSSVAIEDYPNENEVKHFLKENHTALNKYPQKQVLSWLKNDKDYLINNSIKENGIKFIKEKINDNFDLVLIDGSEFTGFAELKECLGSKYIFLDDINSYKNFHSYEHLKSLDKYQLIEEDWGLRNGFALFKNISY